MHTFVELLQLRYYFRQKDNLSEYNWQGQFCPSKLTDEFKNYEKPKNNILEDSPRL